MSEIILREGVSQEVNVEEAPLTHIDNSNIKELLQSINEKLDILLANQSRE